MVVDPFSPIAPARIRVLLVPAGKIKRSRFMTFVERLQPESAIRLGDVTPDPRPDRTMFSPLRNPHGMLLYYFTTSMPPASYISLSPFELFREPLMVLGIADGEEYQEALDSESANAAEDKTNVALKREELNEVVDVMREEYPRAIVHKLLLFDSGLPSLPGWLPEETMLVPPLSESTMTTMKTVMCDLSSLLLAEMTGLAKSLQALPEISISAGAASPNPGNRSPFSLVRQSSFGFGAAENSLSRTASPAQPVQIQQLQKQEATGRRGSLGLRLSPPAENPSRAITPPELSPGEDPSSGRSGETTPTDSAPSRPRALQRFSIQGFGSGSMEEKARLSNACRHDLVDAQVCLMAGHVVEGLKRSHETFLKAELCNEHLVMAKALEQMLICCLILVGHEQEFEIPTSCTPATKGMPVSGTIANVLEWIPELTSRIMGFYRLSFKSDSGHLLTLVDAENKIRVSNLLTAIERLGKKFTPQEFLEKVESQSEDNLPPVKGISGRVVHISNILSEAIDSATQSATITDTERATIYSEAAGCLAKLGLSRKRAFVVTLLMDILVPALLQARKLGAAEMGIHPAAGMLSGGLVQPTDKKYGETVFIFLEQFVREYGVQPRTRLEAQVDGSSEHLRAYGSLVLKAEVLRRCINVCEAMADLQGVLDFSSSFLSIIAPQEPLEETDPGFRCLMPREDQHRLVQNIHRSLEAAKAVGMEQTEATFWYDHLVHSVKYDPDRAGRDLTLRKNVSADDSQQRVSARFEHQAFGDKNKGSAVVPLVAGEPSEFIVTLRNPFAFPLDIESIKLVSAKGVEIACPPNLTYQIPPCAVQPLRVPVVATVPDVHELVKLRVKVRQCRERDFDVSVSRTTIQEVEKMKEMGHSVAKAKRKKEASRPGTATTIRPVSRGMPVLPSVTVVPQQPSLTIKTNLVQDTLSLLEGETKSFKVTVSHDEKDKHIKANILHMLGRNNTVDVLRVSRRSSNLPAQIYELGQDIGRAEWKSRDFNPSSELAPNKTMTFTVDVFGVPGLNKGTVGVEYAAADQPPEIGDYWVTSRVSQEIAVTVQPSVTASHFSILPGREAGEHIEAKFPNANLDNHFVLVFDFLNISDRELSVEAWYDDASMPRQPVLELTSRSDFLKPRQASSMAVLLPKIYLSYSNDAIPAAQDRQFVLTDTHQLSREERMCFWYRQKLLQCLQCRWRDRSGTRHGLVNCAALELTPEMVGFIMSILSISMSVPNALRSDPAFEDPDVAASTLILNADAHPALASTATQPLYLLQRGATASVRVELRNTSAAAYTFTVAPVVRVAAPHLDPDDSIRTRVAQQLLAWVRAVQLDPYKTVVLESDVVAPFGVSPGFVIELGLEVADGPFPASHIGSMCQIQVVV
ncbi:Transport protein Trs120 [Macrophomina phaseolina MS6]|uniref:Transport protein Trs120 n=1 Tax=Macrophomina phaseolina (strain MS6) TaxID=1126212 RepID=K2R9Q6_MACPH|nr:Transport protein Trs120 [Macrophomina phaseolina MS6]